MSTLQTIFNKYTSSTGIDRGKLAGFFNELELQLNENEIDTIFKILLIKGQEKVYYKELKTFLEATRVYDESKYPSTPIKQTKKKIRKSYKIHPEQITEVQTAKSEFG